MALIKNAIPILEYDTEETAVLMPSKEGGSCTERAVLLFMEAEIDAYAAVHRCMVAGRLESITKTFYLYKTERNGRAITFVQAPLGGAGAVQIMEQLIGLGAKKIIAAGCCGALDAGEEGSFFIPTAALRQEGTSYHYLPPAREVELDPGAVQALEQALHRAGVPYAACKTWTTDGFYRETKEMVLYRKSEGYAVVEMECASLAACARMRGVQFGQLLFTADSLADVEAHDGRHWGSGTFAAAAELAMDAAARL